MTTPDETLRQLRQFFDDKIKAHGPTGEGVGWKDTQAQRARYAQLLHLFDPHLPRFSVIDYGCGAGALAAYLSEQGYQMDYIGYDMTPTSIEAARAAHGHLSGVRFTTVEEDLQPADYVVGCGLFSMRLNTPDDEWHAYMRQTIERLWSLATRGIVFNSLTSYSDPEHMRPELFYPDPMAVFDWCKRTLSPHVALYHDYDLYDWTMVVRRQPL
jgi:SAM-dependent methyltransferase